LTEADIVLGNRDKTRLPLLVREFREKREKIEEVPPILSCKTFEEMTLDSDERVRATVKIQDGCCNFCAYCIIPFARGPIRSKEPESAVSEVEGLVKKGYREIVLTGIHLDSYGREHGRFNLCDLLERLDGIEGLERIRLGSTEPVMVTPETVARMKKLKHLCHHFNLSLQSGCTATLKRMRRRYTAEQYAEGAALLREAFDRPALTTDIIVGFPGETEEEFACTEEFLKKIRLYETHIFRYSMRRGTRAAAMPDQIEESVKAQRSARLALLDAENRRAFAAARYGEQTEVLFEETADAEKEGFPAGTQVWTGYTREYIRVVCPSEDDLANRVLTGTLQAPAAEGGACVFTRSDGPGAEN
jgi:threonylcarbamoyladenosine tRNA methylthiotransferase MtaB